MKKVLVVLFGFAAALALSIGAIAGGSVASHSTPELVSEINTALGQNATNVLITLQRVTLTDTNGVTASVVTNAVLTIQR